MDRENYDLVERETLLERNNFQLAPTVNRLYVDDSEAIMTATVVDPIDKSAKGSPENGVARSSGKPAKDLVSRCIGDFGRWQLVITFFLSLVNFPCTFHIFAPTFEAAASDFWCAPPQRLSHLTRDEWINMSHPMRSVGDHLEHDPCYIKDLEYENADLATLEKGTEQLRKCSSWQYDKSKFGQTIVSEWDMVCDKAQDVNLAEMAFLVGVAFGGLASGLISDRFGRKCTLMISIFCQLILGSLIAFSTNFWMYSILRCMLGFFSVSVVFSAFVLCMEIVGGKWLTISGVSFLFAMPLAYVSISGIAYFIKGWRELQLTISLPGLFFIAIGWFFPESPRWYLSVNKGEKALLVLEDAARFNKRELPPNTDKLIKQAIAETNDCEKRQKSSVVDLFRTAKMRKTSLVLYVIWFSVYLVYYGLVLNLSNLGGDIYINSIISGAVEIPAIAVSILILLKMGRRWPLSLTLILSGISCLLTIAVPKSKDGWAVTALATLARFCISSSNAIMPVFTAEQFPTVIRNLGVGASNAPAGIALLLVPYLWNMAEMNTNMPMGVLGVFGIVGGCSVLLLSDVEQTLEPVL